MRFRNFVLLPLLAAGCGDHPATGTPDMAMATLGPPPTLAIACSDQKADVYTLPSGLPAFDASHRGDVFRCAVTESLTAQQVNTQAKAVGYLGPSLLSGFWTWRIAYRTERATPPGATSAPEGDTPATLLVPEKPIPGAPLVVFAHGSVGIGSGCAPSQTGLTDAAPANTDFLVNLFSLAGYGYTVVMPDYNGFAYGQVPGYFNAEDEAHAVLDATRAAAKVLPTPPDKVVIVGHSQGGHAALAAHGYASKYGLQGTLAGVAAYAPFWTSMSMWGAITTPLANFNTTDNSSAILYTMAYFYSAGELLDGPGKGLAVFQAAKQQAAKQVLLGGTCYDTAGLKALGTTPSDFFDSTFVNDVGFNCAANTFAPDCTQGTAPTWLARWKADRPPIDPQGAPILIWYGANDKFVQPGFAQCARDKLVADLSTTGSTTMISYCYDPMAGHNDLIRVDSDHVNRWIAARAGVGNEPATCAAFPTSLTCTVPPNNY